jgi:MFS family permease
MKRTWHEFKALSREERLARNVWIICATRALAFSFCFPLPIIVLYWQEHGMGMAEVMYLQAAFAVALLILDLPNGYLADLIGRKRTIVFGTFFIFLGAVAYAVVESFWGFLVAEILLAIGGSLLLGPDQALLFASLEELKRGGEYKRIFGLSRSVEFIYGALGTICGGLLATIDMKLPFIAAVVGIGLSVLMSLLLHEPERERFRPEAGHLRELWSISRYCLFDNRKMAWLLMAVAALTAVLQSGLWLYQPYFKLCEIPVIYFGWIMPLAIENSVFKLNSQLRVA